jgi:hypothetical protein
VPAIDEGEIHDLTLRQNPWKYFVRARLVKLDGLGEPCTFQIVKPSSPPIRETTLVWINTDVFLMDIAIYVVENRQGGCAVGQTDARTSVVRNITSSGAMLL